jgi:sulfur carrier protein ThiS
MKIQVILHSYLKEKLPVEAKGRTTLDLPEGTKIKDIVTRLNLPVEALCAVNGQIEHDLNCLLSDGDELRFLWPGAGG